MTTRKPKSNLSEKAMLVHLRTCSWTGRTKDKKVTSEICVAKKSDSDAGAWWTYLVPKHVIRNVEATRMKCRNTHFKYTLPWMDGNLRILPAAMFMKYSKEMRKVIAEHDEAIAVFLKEYPEVVRNARKRLGKLIDGRRFPSVQQIKHKFRTLTDILPMPAAEDFRCQLNNDEVKRIQSDISKSIETMTSTAMVNLWEQFTDFIEKIEKTMKEPKRIFRDSLISNLKDFCELIPKMNLTNDVELETLRKEAISKLAALKPIDLRESKADRKKAHKSAKELMEKIKGYTK